jgi:hypothetical protein
MYIAAGTAAFELFGAPLAAARLVVPSTNYIKVIFGII